jgi:hypothetical protein
MACATLKARVLSVLSRLSGRRHGQIGGMVKVIRATPFDPACGIYLKATRRRLVQEFVPMQCDNFPDFIGQVSRIFYHRTGDVVA